MSGCLPEDTHREVRQLIAVNAWVVGRRIPRSVALDDLGTVLRQHLIERESSIVFCEQRQEPGLTALIQIVLALQAEKIGLCLPIGGTHKIVRDDDSMVARRTAVVIHTCRDQVARDNFYCSFAKRAVS